MNYGKTAFNLTTVLQKYQLFLVFCLYNKNCN